MRLLLILLFLVSCADTPVQMEPVEEPAVKPEDCHAILGRDGQPLEPKVYVTRKQYCNLHLQGSGYVDGQLIQYDGKSGGNRFDCSMFYSTSKVSGLVKFKRGKNAIGAAGVTLIPFKSVAVDPSVIKYGTKIFIPSLQGIDGHDGWVIAHDTGGAIKGNHIDFFVGAHDSASWKELGRDVIVKKGYNKVVKSKASGTFTAYINGKAMKLWATFYYLPNKRSCWK